MRTFVLTFCISVNLLAARRIGVDGLILRVETPDIVVAHRPIEGYMPAMVMRFRVANAAALRAGMRVSFEIENGSTLAGNLKITGEDLGGVPKPEPLVPIGGLVPDVVLTDHAGGRVSFDRLTAIQFVYTRCPLENVCPRQISQFVALAKRFEKRASFVSVTLDPEYDTVGRIAGFARQWRPGPWRMATGEPEQIRRLATALGVIYWPEEGVLAHSSATAIIDRKGRLLALAEGSSHRLDQLAKLMEAHMEAQ